MTCGRPRRLIEEAAPIVGAASFTVSAAIRAAAETAPRRGCSLLPPLRGLFAEEKPLPNEGEQGLDSEQWEQPLCMHF